MSRLYRALLKEARQVPTLRAALVPLLHRHRRLAASNFVRDFEMNRSEAAALTALVAQSKVGSRATRHDGGETTLADEIVSGMGLYFNPRFEPTIVAERSDYMEAQATASLDWKSYLRSVLKGAASMGMEVPPALLDKALKGPLAKWVGRMWGEQSKDLIEEAGVDWNGLFERQMSGGRTLGEVSEDEPGIEMKAGHGFTITLGADAKFEEAGEAEEGGYAADLARWERDQAMGGGLGGPSFRKPNPRDYQ